MKIENWFYTYISFLNYSYEDYEGYRFVGVTLWSKITNQNYLGNDFNVIKGMNIELYNEESLLNFLKKFNDPLLAIDSLYLTRLDI